jgi:hypothetical protein
VDWRRTSSAEPIARNRRATRAIVEVDTRFDVRTHLPAPPPALSLCAERASLTPFAAAPPASERWRSRNPRIAGPFGVARRDDGTTTKAGLSAVGNLAPPRHCSRPSRCDLLGGDKLTRRAPPQEVACGIVSRHRTPTTNRHTARRREENRRGFHCDLCRGWWAHQTRGRPDLAGDSFGRIRRVGLGPRTCG